MPWYSSISALFLTTLPYSNIYIYMYRDSQLFNNPFLFFFERLWRWRGLTRGGKEELGEPLTKRVAEGNRARSCLRVSPCVLWVRRFNAFQDVFFRFFFLFNTSHASRGRSWSLLATSNLCPITIAVVDIFFRLLWLHAEFHFRSASLFAKMESVQLHQRLRCLAPFFF